MRQLSFVSSLDAEAQVSSQFSANSFMNGNIHANSSVSKVMVLVVVPSPQQTTSKKQSGATQIDLRTIEP